MNRQRNKRSKFKSLYIWHRYAGLFAALFVIFITITGIALNHTDDLALKKRHISSHLLLEHYRVGNPEMVVQFNVGERAFTQADDLLFIDDKPPIATSNVLVGSVKFGPFIILALSNKLLLIDENNQLVETLSAIDGVPSGISRLGVNVKQQLVLIADKHTYTVNDELNVQRTPLDDNVNWSKPKNTTPQAVNSINQRYQSNIISLETLMLDIHSGRFFGAYGTLFFDVVGIILLFLAFTGVIIWVRQRPKKKAK